MYMDNRTVRVTGNGRMKITPDVTRITLSLEGVCPDYGGAYARCARDSASLKDLLSGFGFKGSDLKTLDLSVDPRYEGYEEEGVYKQRLAGYGYRHVLKLEFIRDNELLGKLLTALAGSPAAPELNISYVAGDPEAAKNELIRRAVKDAESKAAILAEAAGVTLGKLISVDYSVARLDFEISPMSRMMKSEQLSSDSAGISVDIEPDDIELTDTVTLIFAVV